MLRTWGRIAHRQQARELRSFLRQSLMHPILHLRVRGNVTSGFALGTVLRFLFLACVHSRLHSTRIHRPCRGWCGQFGMPDIGSVFAKQVTQSLQSDASLQVLFDLVTERQGGDSGFTFIVPGPPGAVFCFFLADCALIEYSNTCLCFIYDTRSCCRSEGGAGPRQIGAHA